MTSSSFSIIHELPVHDAVIETLSAEAFGPARFTRAAHLVREQGGHAPALSFVACREEAVVGFVRMTPVVIGVTKALMLGPVVVDPASKGMRIGAELMNRALTAAADAHCPLVILVGDEPYYRRFGFQPVMQGRIILPAPVNPARLLARELTEGALQTAGGVVRHINRA